MKINVVGTSGSGKSTFARRLADTLGVPYIELDRLYWRANWQGTPDAAFMTRIAETLRAAPDGWVLDGNYNRTREVKWREVDTIIWLDYGFALTLYQAVKRAIARAVSQQELWPGTGNRESLRQSFFSRESIVWWTIKTWRSNRRRYQADMTNPLFSHLHFVHLRSPAEARNYLRSLTSPAGCSTLKQ